MQPMVVGDSLLRGAICWRNAGNFDFCASILYYFIYCAVILKLITFSKIVIIIAQKLSLLTHNFHIVVEASRMHEMKINRWSHCLIVCLGLKSKYVRSRAIFLFHLFSLNWYKKGKANFHCRKRKLFSIVFSEFWLELFSPKKIRWDIRT